MVEYLCTNCRRKVDYKLIQKKVKCPYCGNKILIKVRPNIVKHIKAI